MTALGKIKSALGEKNKIKNEERLSYCYPVASTWNTILSISATLKTV